MTTAVGRRLTKLEGALRPRQAVLAWLAEVQEFTDVGEYSRRITEVPIEAAPMSVIGRRVDAAVRQDMKGQPREAIDEAVYLATRDALFLFTLVFQVNLDAVEVARVEGLRAAAVFFWMGSLLGGPRGDDIPPDDVAEHERELTSAWASWLSVVDRLDWDVRVATLVRGTLAKRYYAGRDVLFADASTDWAAHVETVERLKWFAESIASSPRGKAARRARARRTALPALEAGVDERMAWITDQAKVRAYEVLGDREKAVAIMERRLLANALPDAAR